MVNLRHGVLAEQLCLQGDFQTQAEYILRKQMLTANEAANMSRVVIADLQNTLSKRWQGYELRPFGSLSIGLGSKTSDVDLNIQFPNVNSTTVLNFLPEIEEMLKKEPTIYSQVKNLRVDQYFLYTLFHIPSQQHVDILYELRNSFLYDSIIAEYYFNLDERFLRLGGLLKLCFNIHGLIGKFTLPYHAVYMLQFFYLQQKNMVLPIYVLQKDAESVTFDMWDVGFNKIPYNSTNTENIYQLLGGFFKYYSEFNFDEYIVSPFAGRPIKKSAFEDLNTFPEEFTLYKDNLKQKLQRKIKDELNCSTICIQNAFEHYSVVGEISHEESIKFKTFIKFAAKMYEKLHSDKFLGAILNVDLFNESVYNHNNTNMDEIKKQDFCTTEVTT